MRVLALDTTTSGGSIALVEDGRVLVERAGDGATTHAQRLPRELLEVLEAAGVTVGEVDVFAVAVGPGSFTGIRIGMAAMQGLSFVTGRPIVPVSVLDALGHVASLASRPGACVGAWIDAHRGDVFGELYRVEQAPEYGIGRLTVLDPARVCRPDVIAAEWMSRGERPTTIVGDGAIVYAGVLDGAVRVLAPPPLAGTIARVALARARSGEHLAPSAIQPLYVRRPDVEVAREQGRDG
jgi:tRNA threonylcarbamoyladenosine biosynthesis protein TsaB